MKLLAVILDGASYERFEEVETPFLDSLCGMNGVPLMRAKAPVPTITYGNHSTILTGCLPGGPGGHGIVGNLFLCPGHGRIVNLDDYDLNEFLEASTVFELLNSDDNTGVVCAAVAEPVTAGAVFVDPMMPYFKLPPLERDRMAAESAEGMIRTKNPDLLVVNFLSVDAAGENHGPDSGEYKEIIRQADAHIARLAEAWRDTAREEIQILVTSDHGMHAVTEVFNTGEALEKAGIPGRGVAASHRAAHIYFDGPLQAEDALEALIFTEAFSQVFFKRELASINMNHRRSGDLFVTAAPGIELQKQGLKGSHGSNTEEEVFVPLVLGGGGWPEALKRDLLEDTPGIASVAGLILSLFGKS